MNPVRQPAGKARASLARLVTSAELEEFHRQLFLPLVWRATWKHGLGKEDAKDVVQEAFVLAITKLEAARSPRAWLTQVVDHLSANHQRKTFRRARLTAKWGANGLAGDESFGEVEDLEREADH